MKILSILTAVLFLPLAGCTTQTTTTTSEHSLSHPVLGNTTTTTAETSTRTY